MLQGRFTIPHRIKVSPECVDILRKMMHPEAKKRATIKELRNHPWTNEGFADRPPAFHHNYPPVPLDNTIVKQMVQMGYTSKEVQAIVRNNHTSPILTTYHAIRNLSVEMVPPFSLLNQDQTSGLPSPTLSLSSEDHSTSSPISISAGSHHVPSDFNSGRGEHGNSDTISSTPPLLRLAIDLPSGEINDNNPGDNNEDIQFNDNNNLDSPSVLTHLTPFADYRSKLGESDYYVYSSSFSPSSPSIPTSHSFPYPHHSPPSSPNISHSQNTLSYRPRGESDPPVHHQIEEEKAIEKERERISLGGSYVASVPPPSPRQFSLEGQQNASPKSKFLNFFAKLVTPSGKK